METITMADLAKVRQWVESMRKLGQGDTVFAFGNYRLTPNQLLQHAEKNDSIWQQVQNYI